METRDCGLADEGPRTALPLLGTRIALAKFNGSGIRPPRDGRRRPAEPDRLLLVATDDGHTHDINAGMSWLPTSSDNRSRHREKRANNRILVANRGEIACACAARPSTWASQRSRFTPIRTWQRHIRARPTRPALGGDDAASTYLNGEKILRSRWRRARMRSTRATASRRRLSLHAPSTPVSHGSVPRLPDHALGEDRARRVAEACGGFVPGALSP